MRRKAKRDDIIPEAVVEKLPRDVGAVAVHEEKACPTWLAIVPGKLVIVVGSGK